MTDDDFRSVSAAMTELDGDGTWHSIDDDRVAAVTSTRLGAAMANDDGDVITSLVSVFC